MKRYEKKGAITVFLSLIGALFLSLLCTAVESARVQGSRAKASAALDMGLFSVMGEFERELLEKYDVFFLDGAAGSGSYSADRINDSLRAYMEYNVNPNKGELLRSFDPFPVSMGDTAITGVSLATDEKGAAFYQQAVGFMRGNLAAEALHMWIERMQEGRQLERAKEAYQKQEGAIEQKLGQMEEQRRQTEQEQQAQNGEGQSAQTGQEKQPLKTAEKKNPLDVVRKLKKEGILGLVLKDKSAVSRKELPSDRPSKRKCRKGNLGVQKKYGGITDNLLFQEYLFERFALFTDAEKEGVLDYALEYILCGKNSDEKNLKSVVTRLLLLREGANFACLSSDEASAAAAQALSASLTGWVPLPGFSTAVGYALMLAWAYGESLLDVRELLAGGRVPVRKDAASWRLDLSSLADLEVALQGADGSCREGLTYAEYLQILFTLGNQKKYPMRALDLMEGYMRGRPETANFRIDHAVYKVEARADFVIPPMFLKIANAFLKTGTAKTDFHVSGSFAY